MMIKDIIGYEDLYFVSYDGEIYRKYPDGLRKITPVIGNNGYAQVSLSKNNLIKNMLIHRIVAQAFIPNPDNLSDVNHKNEIKTDNHVENLEWCTRSHNVRHGTALKRMLATRLSKHSINASKSVIQYDLSGEFIYEYCSASEAARVNNLSAACIMRCSRRERNKYAGFVWRYKTIAYV